MNQFILWRLVPNPKKPDKPFKYPCDWRSLAVADAHDPALWTDRATVAAVAAACGPGWGVGYVLTEADPYWFLDIDNCLTPAGTWSPIAVELCQALAGAYVEVSQSGRGLHIIGSGAVPPHGTKNTPLGLELYHKLRFVSLTGTGAVGSWDAPLSQAISVVAARYFPARPDQDTTKPVEWTDAPAAEWSGPADDDDLIRRMLDSRPSAASTFGGKASIRQLWEADEDALARAYPHVDGAYDASAADAGLAQHLAFWTGKDCERMQQIMLRSALARPKWERSDYLPRTILRAVGLQGPVLGAASAASAASAESPAGSPVAGRTPGPLLASDLAAHFQGAVYIEDRYEAAALDGTLLTPQQFRASTRYGGHRFMLDDQKQTRNAWEAFTENESFQPAMAHSMCFRPEAPPRAIIEDDGKTLYNSYVPIVTPSQVGDAGPFLRHLRLMLPAERDYLLVVSYMAAVVQYPGVKFQWCPVIQGVEGNGKTTIAEVLTYAVGARYCHNANAQDLSNKFNAWIERKLLVIIEEIYVSDRRDALDALKVYVTNSRIEIQGKGGNQYTGDNRANLLAMTNHKDAIPKTLNDRRYAILFAAQQEAADLDRDGMGGDYFPRLWHWLRHENGLAICNGYLRAFQIPDELNPAGAAHRAPVTSSTAEAIEASRGPVEQAIAEAIESGEPGFRGGWVSSHWLGHMLEGKRLRGRAHPNQWNALLRSLGYVKHPALVDGRVNVELGCDGGKKSRLWVKAGSIPALNCPSPTLAAGAYVAANSGLGVNPTIQTSQR